MAGQSSGGFKFWLDGLPVGIAGPVAKEGTFRYWRDGLPSQVLQPSGASVAAAMFQYRQRRVK